MVTSESVSYFIRGLCDEYVDKSKSDRNTIVFESGDYVEFSEPTECIGGTISPGRINMTSPDNHITVSRQLDSVTDWLCVRMDDDTGDKWMQLWDTPNGHMDVALLIGSVLLNKSLFGKKRYV